LHGQEATVRLVLQEMKMSSWVHLACHAAQDTFNPMSSGFYVHDGCLELSTLIQTQFQQADFAFLSSCETSTGDEDLPNEAVHLAAGMLSAGYCSVIATMWAIDDSYTSSLAQDVYSYMLQRRDEYQGPKSIHAAYALHHAVQLLKTKIGD
ncbi:CHAT domain-containing protein, partial [Crucibulum laeve]